MHNIVATFVENKKKYYNIIWTYNVLDPTTSYWQLYGPWKPFFLWLSKNIGTSDAHWSRSAEVVPKSHKMVSLPQFVSEFSQL